MKKSNVYLSLVWLMIAPALMAGYEYTLESKDVSSSAKAEITSVVTDGESLFMAMDSGNPNASDTIIFRAEAREMIVVEEQNKSYMVFDMETLKSIAGQIGGVMSQVEEALKNVPESQRAMMEKMLKDKMPKQTKGVQAPKMEVRKTGKKAKHQGYNTVRYDVFDNGQKIREMWITDWKNVKGGTDVAEAFQNMGEFFEEMLSAFNMPGAQESVAEMKRNLFAQMKDLKGFPVVTFEFDEQGKPMRETRLVKSGTKKTDEKTFKPDPSYRRVSMF